MEMVRLRPRGLLRQGCGAWGRLSSLRFAAPEERGNDQDHVLGCSKRQEDAAWQRHEGFSGSPRAATCRPHQRFSSAASTAATGS